LVPELSVVVPVLDEAQHLRATLEALVESVETVGLAAEVILVDDGSTDGSAQAAIDIIGSRLPLRVVAGDGVGRFDARRVGVEAASAKTVMLLDSRVHLLPGSLLFAIERYREGEDVWTSHVHVETGGNLYATFWKLIADLGWRQYFDNPRTTSFGRKDFDHFPKGTGCFIAPRALLLAAGDAFTTRYKDVRHANDDTTMLRWIAGRRRIHVSPSFAVSYSARTTARAFWRHSIHRGVVFLDGHGRRESRFFPVAVLFFPVSLVLGVSAVRRPLNAPLYVAAVSALGAGTGVVTRRSRGETAALTLAGPIYGLGHAIGMWKGAALALWARIDPRPHQ
jgi:glycosyltransferase involved in cell wall biosynthesis